MCDHEDWDALVSFPFEYFIETNQYADLTSVEESLTEYMVSRLEPSCIEANSTRISLASFPIHHKIGDSHCVPVLDKNHSCMVIMATTEFYVTRAGASIRYVEEILTGLLIQSFRSPSVIESINPPIEQLRLFRTMPSVIKTQAPPRHDSGIPTNLILILILIASTMSLFFVLTSSIRQHYRKARELTRVSTKGKHVDEESDCEIPVDIIREAMSVTWSVSDITSISGKLSDREGSLPASEKLEEGANGDRSPDESTRRTTPNTDSQPSQEESQPSTDESKSEFDEEQSREPNEKRITIKNLSPYQDDPTVIPHAIQKKPTVSCWMENPLTKLTQSQGAVFVTP